jgi:hypothetical protein
VDGHVEEKPKKPSRTDRMRRRIQAFHSEVEQLQSLTDTLLTHLEAAIRPGITDADRIRYRCMIQDIREDLNQDQPFGSNRNVKD